MEADITSRMADLVIQIGVIIFAVRFFGFLAKKVHIAPVLGELLAGVVLGPYALGAISLPGFPEGLFPLNSASLAVSPELYGFSMVASIILLFASGLETDLALFLRYSVAGGVIGIGGVAFSFVIGDVCGMLLLGCGFMDVRCLFLGIMSTATSVGITARILSDKKKMDSPEGVTILASAVFDDVLGIILLAIVMGIAAAVNSASGAVTIDGKQIALIALRAFSIWLVVTALGLIFSKKIANFLKLFKHTFDFSIAALGLGLLLGGFFEKQGLAMIIGAYVTGLSLSGSDIAAIIQERIHGLYEFFVPVFFAVMGMMVNVGELMSKQVLVFGAIYSVTAVLAKVIGCGLPAMAFGFNLKGGLRIGCGMVPRGEVALIIAGIGLTAGILDEQMFGVVILMTLATTLVAPPLISSSLSVPGKGTKKETRSSDNTTFSWDFGTDEIADLVIDMLLKELKNEGFYVQMMNIDEGLSQARKGDISLSITEMESVVTIETSVEDAGFVKNSIYEVVLRLGDMIQSLKQNCAPIKPSMLDPENDACRTDPDVLKLLSPEIVSMHLKGTTKDEVLQEMVMILSNSGLVRDWQMVLDDVKSREQIMSTGMQRGVAFPHAKSDGVVSTCIAIGIAPQGVPFNSFDGEDSRFFVMIVSPRKTSSPHMLLLSSMSFILRDSAVVEKLIACPNAEKMLDIMKEVAATNPAKH
ncbi:MAG: cation:proton antiporter [Treponemataceae bacterium]|mgnify:CR=1 FL=1|nr:cation:proton antiporter [Treponemataceae bacterium]